MEETRTPSIFGVNWLYLLLAIGLVFLGSIVQQRELFSGLIITQYIIILLPNILYLKLRGFSLKKVLKLNPISIKESIQVVFIMIFSYPFAIFLNAVFLMFLQNFTEIVPSPIPVPTNINELLLGFFVIAISPGICEEVMFRGTFLNAYSKLGYKKAIIISSLLFGLYHFNIFNFIGPVFLGILFGIMVYKTDSIYSSMIGHTVNNGLALVILYLINKYEHLINDIGTNGTETLPVGGLIMGLTVIGILASISMGIAYILLKKLPDKRQEIEVENVGGNDLKSSPFAIAEYFPIIITMVIFIVLNYKFILM